MDSSEGLPGYEVVAESEALSQEHEDCTVHLASNCCQAYYGLTKAAALTVPNV